MGLSGGRLGKSSPEPWLSRDADAPRKTSTARRNSRHSTVNVASHSATTHHVL